MKHSWQDFFKGKKVTVMGIDPEGRGLQDALLCARYGAAVIATDIKTQEQLAESVVKLSGVPGIVLRLGGHDEADFAGADLVIRAASTPLQSPYLDAARRAKVRIETDETLFLSLAPEIAVVGVTGTRGKTTTTHLIYEILRRAYPGAVHIAGNVRGTAALPLLEKVNAGDMVVFELSSWQLQQFGESKRSPQIAVFTSFMPDHLNYYQGDLNAYLDDKAQIFLHQTRDDVLVVGAQAAEIIKERYGRAIRSKVVIATPDTVPQGWRLKILGAHNRANVACAVATARALGIDEEIIHAATEGFSGVPGRLERLREVEGVTIYNDTTATTPDAAAAGLAALAALDDPMRQDYTGRPKSVVVIAGGTDKQLDPTVLAQAIGEYAKAVVLLSGSGTEKLKELLRTSEESEPVAFEEYGTLAECVAAAVRHAEPGDALLFSPGFASFEKFNNEYDRGAQFVELVQSL